MLPKKGCLSNSPTLATTILSNTSLRNSSVTSISGVSTFSNVSIVIVPIPYYCFILLYLMEFVNQKDKGENQNPPPVIG